MPRSWRIAPFDETYVRMLSGRLRISPILAQVLCARGHAEAVNGEAFLEAKLTALHPPEKMCGLPEAADRITAAVASRRKIIIYGDYDVDGVTATSLLWHCLTLAGGLVEYYIPHRLEEGYGLHADALRQLAELSPGALVVTVDCGICSAPEADLALALGLELIVTDHHQPGPRLPAAAAIVHPRLPPGVYPFGELCGAGVAFKLAWAVCQRLGDGKRASERMREFLLSAVGLAAIGTVADCVPLIDENRSLVRHGLVSLRERASIGLKMLMKLSGLGDRPLQAEDIAFALAPRLNAAGRLGQARLAVELLTTENQERAATLATYLEEQNKLRQQVERRILKQAKELVAEHPEWLERPALVLAHSDWHAGVIGIVASRVAEHFERPAVMIALSASDGRGQGSARSFGGFDLHAGLVACGDHLLGYGGHQAAAGLRIASDRVDPFRHEFCEYAAAHHRVEDADRDLCIDAEICLVELTVPAVRELERLGPFGRGNPRPVFASTRVELVEPPKKMGEGERHLSLRVRQHGRVVRAISFGNADWADEISAHGGPISLCFAPQVNTFRNQESVELRLLDWQPAAAPVALASP